MNIYIRPDQAYTQPLKYILQLLQLNKKAVFSFVADKSIAVCVFDHSDERSVYIDTAFYESLLGGNFDFTNYFHSGTYIQSQNKETDFLATAFFMVNSFQEFNQPAAAYDNIGRFKYERSYQYKFDCIEKNIVQECFDLFCSQSPGFDNLKGNEALSRVFLSHDIDSINGSFLQDGMWALKKGRIDIILQLMLNEIVRRPDWTNFDKIINIHNEYQLKSTFFWLVNKHTGSNNIKNADYTVKSVQPYFDRTISNGLHKSCTSDSLESESAKLPFKVHANRYHFLNFQLPSAWQSLEKAGIKLDASLGFAERYGFRNSYGLPFSPYNPGTGTSYSFVEVPLNLMDGTFHKYMQYPTEKTGDAIINFIEKNKQNCILSILWHNTYFTQYKYRGYLHEYKKVLAYLFENKIKSISPDEIISEYGSRN